jgi:hypothetical protein
VTYQCSVAPLTDRVAFRLPSAIASSWKSAAKAQDQTLSDWLRSQVRLGEIKHDPTNIKPPRKREVIKKFIKIDPVFVRELARIGSNLNQIARQINHVAAASQTIDMVSVLVALQAIQTELHNALHSRRGSHDE